MSTSASAVPTSRPHTAYEVRTEIETTRLVLRPIRRSDATFIVNWRREASEQFLTPQPTMAEHLAWFSSERPGRVDYAVIDKSRANPIGLVNFKNIDEAERTAEVGKLIGVPSYRGHGYAKEATTAWLLYGFGDLGLERIVSWTRHDNHANIHVNAKLGYIMTDERQPGVNGSQVLFVKMILTRQRFLDVLCDRDPYLTPLVALVNDRHGESVRPKS